VSTAGVGMGALRGKERALGETEKGRNTGDKKSRSEGRREGEVMLARRKRGKSQRVNLAINVARCNLRDSRGRGLAAYGAASSPFAWDLAATWAQIHKIRKYVQPEQRCLPDGCPPMYIDHRLWGFTP